MDEMQKLTARQQQVLAFIREYMATNGYPPTRVDIARELGFRSPNAAEDHLKALARKGAIEMIPGASRGIRLPSDAEAADEHSLPVVGQVAAGAPILALENIENHCRIDPDFFSPRADYLLRVRGIDRKSTRLNSSHVRISYAVFC